jgi:NAD-dependent deacetylase
MIFPDDLIDRLRTARHIVVFTGAGVSAESGVPTFRDALAGLWENFSPEELATPEAFLARPRLVWDWYTWRRELVGRVEPNPGHRAIATLEEKAPRFTLVTQNVDGLHVRAGSRRVIELHGNIQRVKCFDHGHPAEHWQEGDPIPRCRVCGSLLRPDVVWFTEDVPAGAFEAAKRAARDCDAFLAVGTSMLVFPAAELPYAAARAGAAVIQVNPNPTDLDALAHFNLKGKSGEVLPALIEAVWS